MWTVTNIQTKVDHFKTEDPWGALKVYHQLSGQDKYIELRRNGDTYLPCYFIADRFGITPRQVKRSEMLMRNMMEVQ